MVVKDASLGPTERNAAIQKILRGEYDALPPATAATSAATTTTTTTAGTTTAATTTAAMKTKEEGPAPPTVDSSIVAPSNMSEAHKRAAIQGIMKDAALAPSERNQSIQKIIKGEYEVPKEAAEAKVEVASRMKDEPPPQMDATSESEDGSSSSSDEVDEESEDGTKEEEEKESEVEAEEDEEEEEEEEGEAWASSASSSSYKTSSSSEDDETARTAATAAATVEAQAAVAAAAMAFIQTANSEQEDPARSEALEKQRRRALLLVEAQLDRELQGHTLLEEEQRRRESEFLSLNEEEERERVASALATMQEEQQQSQARATASASESRRLMQEERELEIRLIRTLREEEELEKRTRQDEEERVRVASALASMQEEQDQAKVRAAAAVAESQRLLQEEREREERRIQYLREEAEREERRIQNLRDDMDRAVQQRRLHEGNLRLQEEREQEQLRLRALQAERERQQRLVQEEKELELRRLNEQRELHHRLEMERIQRGRGQEELQTHGQDLVQEAARAVAPRNATARRDPSAERSLRASQALASRQEQDSHSTMSPAQSVPYATPASRPNLSNSQLKPSRYDGVEDDELNWRLDSYVSLSDFTIIVNRARPGPDAPDFETLDFSSIDFVTGSSGGPKQDVYYVHKAMIAVGSRRSELLGRRIRDAENSRGGAPDGHSSEVNVHETVMLESAANTMGVVLDFCYNPECLLDVNVENAVPLVYLGKRYKIRALLEQAEAYVMGNIHSTTAIYFLLDSYLYRLEDILGRAIDVTAANLADTVDFDPIYKLPPELFRRSKFMVSCSFHSPPGVLLSFPHCTVSLSVIQSYCRRS